MRGSGRGFESGGDEDGEVSSGRYRVLVRARRDARSWTGTRSRLCALVRAVAEAVGERKRRASQLFAPAKDDRERAYSLSSLLSQTHTDAQPAVSETYRLCKQLRRSTRRSLSSSRPCAAASSPA